MLDATKAYSELVGISSFILQICRVIVGAADKRLFLEL